MPGSREFAFFEPCADGPLAVAHRGGIREGEEPLAALRRTAELGIRFLEVDLRATADGRLVVWHGRGLERVRPDRPLDTRRLDATLLLPFEDALEALPSETRFFVDLKDTHAGGALALVLRRTGAADRICVGSFSHRRTSAAAAAIARETGYRPPTTMTPRQLSAVLARAARPPQPWRPPFASAQLPRRLATRRIVRTVHAGGAVMLAWTIDDEETMRTLLDRGADGIITDEPELLLRVVGDRRARA